MTIKLDGDGDGDGLLAFLKRITNPFKTVFIPLLLLYFFFVFVVFVAVVSFLERACTSFHKEDGIVRVTGKRAIARESLMGAQGQ